MKYCPAEFFVSTMSGQLQEKCGIVALYMEKISPNLPLAFSAARGIQHRGQQGVGVALQTKGGIKTYKNIGLLREVFTKGVIRKLNQPSRWMMIHCRYGTFGDYSETNLQPCIANSPKNEKVAVIHNGEFIATEGMRRKLRGRLPTGVSDTYLFTRMLAKAEGVSWEEKILAALSQVTGAYSLIIGVKDKLFAARDPQGIRPLVIGQVKDGWLIASETHAFDKAGAKVSREIKKGEVIRIDQNGLKVLRRGLKGTGHFCDFEWAYFGRPDSLLPRHGRLNEGRYPDKWLSLAVFRERCGRILAKESPVSQASFVVGVPDSGIAVGTGYANALKIPYQQVIIRDHFDAAGDQRLFMRDDQMRKIRKKVLGKLSLVPDQRVWRDAVVVVTDDSIVRGNVSRQITKAIFSFGAKEVHWILGFPPVTHYCYLGISIRTGEELIANRYQGDPIKIAKKIGATSVNYISPSGFIQARLLSSQVKIPQNPKEIFLKNHGCGGCLTGLYPVAKDADANDYQIRLGESTSKGELRMALLISGGGSTAQAIIKAYRANELNGIRPVVVISSCPDAGGLGKAQALGIPTFVFQKRKFSSSEAFGDELLGIFKQFEVDLLSQNGWLPWTPANIVTQFRGRIINQHPGPLDPGRDLDFGGQGMYGSRVTCARLAYSWSVGGDFWTEAATHYVNEQYDKGDLILVKRMKLPRLNSSTTITKLRAKPQQLIDTTKQVQTRLLPLEHANVIATLKMFAEGTSVPGYQRPKPLIPKRKEHLVHQAKKLAIKLFPDG